MKFSNILALLPFAAAGGSHTCPNKSQNSTTPLVPKDCYKAACTMSIEQVYHVKLFYNRKQGITPQEFNRYWAYNHAALATPFHLRLGVVKYSQYHSTPELRDLIRVEGAPPILEFDGAAEFWVQNLETLQAMQTDPEYVNKIQPDEANFMDLESARMIIGVDYIVVQHQNEVKKHGRTF